ncbi:MAG: Gfo/Idh/MocA family oxidoreductase, partial [Candidatus Glassbacteria bacterium]|nr:Gfo/Idh/MocA family oxidoreductase [Candidatus Glassbacteria bacterium]
MEKKRIAVVGAGYISRSYHCPALAKLREKRPWLELAAVCDLVPERAREAAARFNFTAEYPDAESLLAGEKIDAAYILIDPGHIKDMALRFIRRGIPCLIEKPPGKNSAEVKELAKTAGSRKVPCLVALNRRFMPLVVRAGEIISGFEHPPQLIEAQIIRHRRTDADFAYGTAVHSVDAMRFLMGDVAEIEVKKLKMQGSREHSYLADIIFRSGARGRLTVWPEAGVDLERYTVHGNDFSLLLEAPLEWTIDYPGRIICFNGRERQFI